MLTDWIANALLHHPELALFLALAVGYVVGKMKLGSHALDNTEPPSPEAHAVVPFRSEELNAY